MYIYGPYSGINFINRLYHYHYNSIRQKDFKFQIQIENRFTVRSQNVRCDQHHYTEYIEQKVHLKWVVIQKKILFQLCGGMMHIAVHLVLYLRLLKTVLLR